ncbi:MAG: hypothetical protein HOJ34_14310 [Kordiimonadaceae bacterium]|jgi:periplasmic protein TonB|nr:hypothetical protein [Kordiimonadaceae bacterium]MBT6035313.1 hypothetical protein [Kordiimonadaceae bacterium]MBT6330949.1 hypothetical protein [Kordiimonadaceae bacterium]MBT7581842.1 hypothetical protein [Kordiimonadaceae bacterium]
MKKLILIIYAVMLVGAFAQTTTRLINIGPPVHFVAPQFPEGVSPSNEIIRLQFTVAKSGDVLKKSIEVIETSNVLYNQSAIDALSQFKYKPRLEDGIPVATPNSRTTIEYQINVR